MKKMLVLIVIVLTLVCSLASCGHEHQWSEWEWSYDTKATYSKDGTESRYCSDCGETEYKTVTALGDAGVYKLLNGHWRERGASADDSLIDIHFDNSKFTATVYLFGEEWDYLGGSGSVEITEELITLKNNNGSTYTYFTYEIGDDIIVMIDYDMKVWEKYEP